MAGSGKAHMRPEGDVVLEVNDLTVEFKLGKNQIVKAVYSEAAQKALAAGHAKGKFITPANAVVGAGIPFHPGAEKFYKEAGLLK